MSRRLRSPGPWNPGKTLIPEGLGAGLQLAIKAAVLVCALSSQSCLVPQSVDAIPVAPYPAPRFVLESIDKYLLPPIIELYRGGASDQSAKPPCHCRLDLAIPLIEEDDPTVSLEARWFVDYDPNVPRLSAILHRDPLDGTFDSTGTTLRTVITGPFPFDADQLGIFTDGIHVVDVVLAETAAFEISSTRPNRAIKAGYPSAEHRFVINVKVNPDPARPTCTAVPPSVAKVCQ